MTSAASVRYERTKLRLSADPLAAMARLAGCGLYADYVVYENEGCWTFAAGVLAEVTAHRDGAALRYDGTTVTEASDDPLTAVGDLLASIPVDGWRAYGWAAFELAYALAGDRDEVGAERLVHLFVPRTEVRVEHGWAFLRSVDRTALDEAVAALASTDDPVRGVPHPMDVQQGGGPDYQQAVKLAVEEINARHLQKVILSRSVEVQEPIDFVATYVCGRRGNRPARSFLVRLDGVEAAGFSPEIVVQVDTDGRVVSQPLAGTRALTADPKTNARLRGELQTDAKEIFEHAISVKAACEELQPVCVPDSLAVEEFMAVRERGSVQHLASRVAGRVLPGRQAWDCFRAVFPAVTASGLPKLSAYRSIRRHETRNRGLYSGAVLMLDQAGAMDAALVLRAVHRRDGRTWLQAGAGLVEQSTPDREFEETCEKLRSVAQFLVRAVPEQ
ncbi:MAG TPA: salicylate synthase [Actinoplanes sp.]|nr:salicylate synthase [Actinoplanes sp.]